MVEQISIYELVEPAFPDFRNIEDEDTIKIIENQCGIRFNKPDYEHGFKRWTLTIKPVEVDVYFSAYKYEERLNEPFISVNFWNKKLLSGCGIPCDSIEQAVKVIKREIKYQ